MRINPTLEALGAYPMAALQDKARALRSAGVPLLDFSIGDPREPTPEFVKVALRGAVPDISQYPTTAGLPETRQAIADYVERRFGVRVDPDTQVIPTAGSKEAIFSAPLAFVDRAVDPVVVHATPGYPIYERGARLAGAAMHTVRLADDFVFRADMIPNEVWERASVVWLNTPHNPTGAVIGRAELERFVQRAGASDTLLCADECYVDLYEGEPPPSTLQVADDRLSGVLSFLSLSKRSGMTGYRAAAIVGDADAVAALKVLRSSTGTASPEFVQAAAAAAWADDDHVAPRRSIFAQKRAILRRAFAAAGYDSVASEAGLYLWVRVGDDRALADRLLDAHVVVSAGSAFGPGGEGYLRLALVPTIDECNAAVEVLERCLTEN